MKTYKCYKSGGRDAKKIKANSAHDAMLKYCGVKVDWLRGITSKHNPSEYASEIGLVNVYEVK
ncbi:MAG: hypothetical protein ACYTFK_12590 [Planctomycetota bacterium]|jgi:hypothetical protein